MLQPRQKPGFAVESLREGRVGAVRQRQQFQGDRPVELRLPRLVNHAHSADPDQLDDLKIRKRRAHGLDRRGVIRSPV